MPWRISLPTPFPMWSATAPRPRSASYVECHGTATPLGDPIEIAGLAKAFGATTDRKGFCAIGTVKTNIGHLDIASGVAGLIKTILALEHESLPATLHFKALNPKLGLEESPFRLWSDPFGLGLGAAHLMRHPTIAELARAANDLPEESMRAASNAAPSLQSFRRRAGASR
jgi:hypothetical protein